MEHVPTFEVTIERLPAYLLAWHGTRLDGSTCWKPEKETVGVKSIMPFGRGIGVNNRGFHAAPIALYVLMFAEGLFIRRVLCEGHIHIDSRYQIACSERTVLAHGDCTVPVLEWAFWCGQRALCYAADRLCREGEETLSETLSSLRIADLPSAIHAAEQVQEVALAARGNAAVSTIRAIDAACMSVESAIAAMKETQKQCLSDFTAPKSAYSAAVSTISTAANAEQERRCLNMELERRLLSHLGLTAERTHPV